MRKVTVRLTTVIFDARDPVATARFWADLLGKALVAEPGGATVPGDTTQVGLRFVASEREQVGRRRLHLHLISESAEHQQRIVQAVLRLGGRHLDVGQDPDAPFVVLADVEGNELCVISPGNQFLAGTGLLGEVTVDGTRDVGLFWRDALGWTLVWDEDEETAVQAPLGGTKVSWGGPPVEPPRDPIRQRFELVTDDLEDEIPRLISLGATHVADRTGAAELTDPDGYPFTVRAR